ncbi:MAG: Clp protease ClpP [Beijerinckiaceae bacterium]|nr:Clp protease ClpP [Beijerinckiaceae bacterium]
MMRSWFTAKAAADSSADVAIYDEIGMWGVSARDFRDALKELGQVEQINLSINSPGGSVFDGIAIHNMLARHKAKVTVHIDGVAASIASVIAMAGDEIVMPQNAMMMIHNPAGVVVGQSKDMRDMAEALDKIRDAIVSSYSQRTKMQRDEINALLDAETWLTADEAVEMGFADRTTEPVQMAASFDLSKFKHPPTGLASANRDTQMTMHDTRDAQPAAPPAQQPDSTPAPQQPDPALPPPARATEQQSPQQQLSDPRGQECADIVAACDLAGQSGRAVEFIASGKSLRDIIAELRTSTPRGAARSIEVSARHDVTANGQEPAMRVDIVAGMKKQFGVA